MEDRQWDELEYEWSKLTFTEKREFALETFDLPLTHDESFKRFGVLPPIF